MRIEMRRKRAPLLALLFCALFGLSAAFSASDARCAPEASGPVAPSAGALALRGAKVFTGTGAVHHNGVILIRNGKIEAVGADLNIPAGYTVRDFGSATIAPGLVDPDTALGARGSMAEPVTAIQPDVSAEDVFDRFHDDFERALAAGITTVLITPSGENVVGGTAAAVKTAGDTLGERIVRTSGPLVLSVGPAVQKRDRLPTSRIGAVDLLEQTLEGANAGTEGSQRLRAFARGKLDGFFRADRRIDVETAISLQKKYGLRLTLVGVGDGWRMIDRLEAAGLPLIVGGYSFNTEDKFLKVPARAAKAGLKIAFTAGAPYANPAALRTTAALAVRHGLDRQTALKAITGHPAEITGIAHRVGSLLPGKDADLVVFSGDPLDLSSRLLSVYVNGALVYARCENDQHTEREVCR